jgi:hypothetical protein
VALCPACAEEYDARQAEAESEGERACVIFLLFAAFLVAVIFVGAFVAYVVRYTPS